MVTAFARMLTEASMLENTGTTKKVGMGLIPLQMGVITRVNGRRTKQMEEAPLVILMGKVIPENTRMVNHTERAQKIG